jgi:hypothetical protein
MPNIGDIAADFFRNTPPSDIDSDADSKSKKEEADLFKFTGNFSSLEEYLIHEEHIIKKLDKTSKRVLKEKNAKLAFQFSSIWAIFIALIILFRGFKKWSYFDLSQSEFLFIIGSLTTSVFAFYIFVLKYLFNKDSD